MEKVNEIESLTSTRCNFLNGRTVASKNMIVIKSSTRQNNKHNANNINALHRAAVIENILQRLIILEINTSVIYTRQNTAIHAKYTLPNDY
jgi:hypothetical protein